MAKSKKTVKKSVETIRHEEASRKNIPTAEYQAVVLEETKDALRVAYERRNRDLDPQLVWRGKDEQDWSDLVVQAPPIYIQEKVHPKVLVDDLMRRTERAEEAQDPQFDLFGDFNGVPEGNAKTEFYQHDANWTNRMILGDSLQVMASLAEREGLRGQVQCIYIDPPYGIKFNSNFQWSTTSRDVKDGNAGHITREPEQVRAFRDTWRDGIHSYLTYLRDRLTAARDLLTDSGSIFVQIGDENVHRVRGLLDEVFGPQNYVAQINFAKTTSDTSPYLSSTFDLLLWYSKRFEDLKYRQLYNEKIPGEVGGTNYNAVEVGLFERKSLRRADQKDLEGPHRIYSLDNLTSQSMGRDKGEGAASWFPVRLDGRLFRPSMQVRWKTNEDGMGRLAKARRLDYTTNRLGYVRYLNDFPVYPIRSTWSDVGASFMADKTYVVQTVVSVVERCLLMATDPGDLVIDPTCGSGTTAFVAEQWGRRWITVDTSRVALTLARARVMGARYAFYVLADSIEGARRRAESAPSVPRSHGSTSGDIRQGFVYESVPHITLRSITNNAEIDVIWEQFQRTLEPLRTKLNAALGKQWEEWDIPRDAGDDWSKDARKLHAEWWEQRIARQKEIDASIAAKADFEYLYDKPYVDNRKVRVAGPFTVESLSPHRTLAVGSDDELIDPMRAPGRPEKAADFAQMILENLKTAGVQQAHKQDKIDFSSIAPWPGHYVCAEGRYQEGENGSDRRAAIFIGPEFGTVARSDLAAAAREAGEGGFDTLVACAFAYDGHSTGFDKLGPVRVLRARMNADLHMAEDLKNTGKGNLFVIFGEPDIEIRDAADGQIEVEVKGVDVFDPSTGEVRSDGPDGIACWFIDTDYNEESFFVRHAYFLGANDPYKALKTTLKAEINEEAWESLHSATSRPFDKPETGRIAVKVINHLGDEVMKVFRVP